MISVVVPDYFSVVDRGKIKSTNIAQGVSGFNRLQDISSRAKTGIKVGDIQREAHLAFCMATISEESSTFMTAIKFYKRLYFCAKLLEDQEGSEIALNRMGICY